MDPVKNATEIIESDDTNPWAVEEDKYQEWDKKLEELGKCPHLEITKEVDYSLCLPELNASLLKSYFCFNLDLHFDRWKRLLAAFEDANDTSGVIILEDTLEDQLKLEILLFSDRDTECRKLLARGLLSQVWGGVAPKSAPWYSKTMQLIRDFESCCFLRRLVEARCMINCEPLLLPYNDIALSIQGFMNGDYKDETAWSPYIEEEFIYKLFSMGYITIAVNIRLSKKGNVILIPKMHKYRSYLVPIEIRMLRKGKKAARDLTITIDRAFHKVVSGIVKQHGENWVYPEMQTAFNRMHYQKHRCNTFGARIHSVEVWKNGELVAGEIGVANGAVYTSVTGFHSVPWSGTFQMYALGAILHFQGFEIWDLGMEIPYKLSLGAKRAERSDFIRDFQIAKTKERSMEIPDRFKSCESSMDLIEALSEEQTCQKLDSDVEML